MVVGFDRDEDGEVDPDLGRVEQGDAALYESKRSGRNRLRLTGLTTSG